MAKCRCEGTNEEKRKNWVVINRRCNYSAFHGYHRTPSNYSALICKKCNAYWRTKANYVLIIPNGTYDN